MGRLNLDGLYAKTAKGREELAQRSSALPRATRSVLILMDGKAPLRDLLKRYEAFPSFDKDVEALLDQGFIAELPQALPANGRARDAIDPGDTTPGTEKQRLIQIASRLLGAHAAAVIGRLEKSAESSDDLAASIESCYKLIKLTIDEKKAEQFREAGRRVVNPGG